jgi:molybdenum ABC transporter molybdate-binding protein
VSLEARLAVGRRHFSVEVDLHAETETLVVVGPSGCGKSTVLRALAGLLTPTAGRITLGEQVLYDSSRGIDVPPEQRRVGVVFQNYALFPHLDVVGNLGYGLPRLPAPERERRIGAALERVRLTGLAGARPSELSGGEQQRVAVARALITEPRLLLLDEPLSALDVDNRANLRRELAILLHQLAIPTVVVTHDLADAETLADRIAVMDRGRIVQTGAVQDVIDHPTNAFVAQFTGANVIPRSLLDPHAEPAALVAVDPARIGLDRGPVTAHSWSTTVTSLQPRGSMLRIGLATPPGAVADIPATATAAGGVAELAIGDTVTAHADPDGIRPLLPTPAIGPDSRSAVRPSGGPHTSTLPVTDGLHRIVAVALGVITALILVAAFLPAPSPRPAAAAGSAGAGGGTLTAYVAANATEVFNTVIDRFERQQRGVNIRASYAGTQILFTQLQQGASADLFLSADESFVKQAVAEGLIPSYDPVSANSEVLVVPRSNPAGISSLQDLATKPAKLIIGVPNVPIGKYTRQIFNNAAALYGPEFPQQALAQVVSAETDVKQVLNKVALNEADAGIVYRTDVTPNVAEQVTMIELPEAVQVLAINYIGVLTRAPNQELARQLRDYMLSPTGQSVFTDAGFRPIPATPAPATPDASVTPTPSQPSG